MGSMAMPTQERSKPLHNFSLPCLKWGTQRVLRCVKIPPPPPPPPPHHHHHHRQSSVVANGAIHSRPTIPNPVQHRPSSSNPDLATSGGGGDDSSPPPSRPWNLRTRRAACKAPGVRGAEEKGIIVSNGNNNFNDSGKRGGGGAFWEIESSPAAKRQCLESPPPLSMNGKVNNMKLCVPLTRDEIEEDFMEIARMRPPRRPKKRPRIVQKYMDLMFPGLWITEVTTDLYKVPEVQES